MTSRPPDAAWNNAERELLAAAREDRMPAALEARPREALDFLPGTAPGSAEVPTIANTDPSASFGDAARARPLFAGKFSLWGMLGLVALGAVSYFALVPASSQPLAATPAPAQHNGSADVPRAAATPPDAEGHELADVDGSARAKRVAAARGVGTLRIDTVAHDAVGDGPTRDDEALQSGALAHDAVGGGRSNVRGAATAPRELSARDAAAPRRPAAQALPVGSQQPMAAAAARTATAVDSPEPGADLPNATAAQGGKADQLRVEAELLEHARSALGQAALSDARQWLARYQTQFANGALQPESQVLGIELKVRTGARTAAKEQAEHFLAQHPKHPLRDRVRQLTEGP